MPSQYLEDIAVLDTLIVEKIRDHVEISEDVEKALEAYRTLRM